MLILPKEHSFGNNIPISNWILTDIQSAAQSHLRTKESHFMTLFIWSVQPSLSYKLKDCFYILHIPVR